MKTITQKIREEIITSSFGCFVAGIMFMVGLSELSHSEYLIVIPTIVFGIIIFTLSWNHIKIVLKNLKYCAVV